LIHEYAERLPVVGCLTRVQGKVRTESPSKRKAKARSSVLQQKSSRFSLSPHNLQLRLLLQGSKSSAPFEHEGSRLPLPSPGIHRHRICQWSAHSRMRKYGNSMRMSASNFSYAPPRNVRSTLKLQTRVKPVHGRLRLMRRRWFLISNTPMLPGFRTEAAALQRSHQLQ
jgi:hypothetical protein